MSDSNENTSVVIAKSASVALPRKKKPINYALTRILKEQKFSPLTQLLRDVYPQLKIKDKMRVLLELMKYLYPTISAATLSPIKRQKSGPAVQVGVQVNQPAGTHATTVTSNYTLRDLLEAAQNDQKTVIKKDVGNSTKN